METLADFIKNVTLLSLLNFLITVILILVGLVVLVGAQKRATMRWLLAIAVLPFLSGLLTMYWENRILDRGFGMFGRLDAEAIGAGRREALVSACIGALGAVLMLLMGVVGLKLKNLREG